ncbi:MAG TPA: CotH kinase family protein [Myxococcota bacterium]|nr:CotH kinase family protein [Myxococcota bacterium]
MIALLACAASVPSAEDSRPEPNVLPDGPGSEYGGDSDDLFDPQTIHRFVVTTESDDWEGIVEHPEKEEYIRATVELGDVRVEDVGVRFKGSWGSLFWCADGTMDCDKLNLKFDFHEYDEEQRFYELKKLNFHAMEVDDSNMREHLAYKVWRDAGVPASRTGWATLEVNGEDLGLFLLVEQVDGRFTRHRWGSEGEGDLYKEVWLTETSVEAWRAGLESNREESPTPERMVEMAEALSATTDEDFVAVLSEWMDPAALTRFLAALELTGSFDSITAFYCAWGACNNHNYFWYDKGDEIVLIPWDMDRSFAVPVPLFDTHGLSNWHEESDCERIDVFGIQALPPSCDPFFELARATTLVEDYQADLDDIHAGAASLESLETEIDRLEVFLAEAVADDPVGPTQAEWRAGVDDLRGDIADLTGRY